MKMRNATRQGITITIGNQKGGVSKTTTTCMLAYSLANKGYKTLVVDLDPQGNATKLLWLTSKEDKPIKNTLMSGLLERNLQDIRYNVMENLDMLPSHVDLELLPEWLFENVVKKDRDLYLANLLQPLKLEYDFILIDTPPMALTFTKNAVCSSDFVLIVLQTQERSLTGAEYYIQQIAKLKEAHNLEVDIIGLVRVLVKNQGTIDNYISNKALESYGEFVFNTVIPNMERLKRYDVTGIQRDDHHDDRVMDKYNDLADELIERLKKEER